MKLKGKISLFINSGITTIEIEDDNANTTFLKVELTEENIVAALSRQFNVACDLFVSGLDRIGKKHECNVFEFEIPENLTSSKDEDELQKLAQSQLSDGWVAEKYFSSQRSFFRKDGKSYARCTIRRYV